MVVGGSPSTRYKGKGGGRMMIVWAPGITNQNNRRDTTPPYPIVMEKGADLSGYRLTS